MAPPTSTRSRRAATPSLVWLHVAKAAKVVGLVTAQQLLRDFAFSVSGIVFWAFISATVLLYLFYRPRVSEISSLQWPKLSTIAFLSWARLWFILEALKQVSVVRVLMFTEYAGIWVPLLSTNLASKGGYLVQKRKGALFIALGVLFEFGNDIAFASVEDSYMTVRWLFLCCAIAAGIMQAQVKSSLHELDDLTIFSLTSPIGVLFGIVPYVLFGHSSTVLEAHSLAHLMAWMIGIGISLLLLDMFGTHSARSQGAMLYRMVTRGWFTAVATAALLAAIHRTPSIFDMAGMILFYNGVRHVMGSSPQALQARNANSSLAPLSTSNQSTAMVYWRMYVKPIWENKDSKAIFIFLCINLGYMFVQLLYGVWTNSLGLISDAIHMFFDCIALAVGLFAAVMAKWGANPRFSFGYGRIETLSGFGNGIFLIFISIFIFLEGVERIIHPPEMNTDRLLLIAFLGFVVNMIGIFSFHHGHGHGHSHGGGECSHSHDNANMQGVFLHILADALGSLGVIISTLLIYQFEWTGFDPLASLLIAVLIFISTIPLLKSSLAVLMCTVPSFMASAMSFIVDDLYNMGNVQHVEHRAWSNDGGDSLVLLRITLTTPPVDEFALLRQVQSLLAHHGITKSTIEFQYINDHDGQVPQQPQHHIHHEPTHHSHGHYSHPHPHSHEAPLHQPIADFVPITQQSAGSMGQKRD